MGQGGFLTTPPMGWNSYDYYDTTVTEADVLKNARVLAEKLLPFGWEYVVVDIQWYAHGAGSRREEFQYIPFSELEMDAYGRLLPDPARFPTGFRALGEQLHAMGLKFGIHIMRGVPRIAAHRHLPVCGFDATCADIADPSSICGWNPDMYGVRDTAAGQAYYDSLLALYASWGVDYIKCDDICNTNLYENRFSAAHEIRMLREAIDKTGREIVLSLSPGPALLEKAEVYQKYANLWRVTDDFWDEWRLVREMFPRCRSWAPYVGEASYPDCDMLPFGVIGGGFGQERVTRLSRAEQRTVMLLWCLFGSPLMLGAELTKLDEETLALLTDRRYLKLLPPWVKPSCVWLEENSSLWEAHDERTGADYRAFFNLSGQTALF
ncbi:MAG: glycoside hydrolase family 27 protein, partial [bacterium]